MTDKTNWDLVPMSTQEAIGTIETARWRPSGKEHKALEVLKAMALEVEEMREQMAEQDAQIEKLCVMSGCGKQGKM